MSRVRRPSAALRPYHEERVDHFCHPSNLNASLLIQWTLGRPPSCEAGDVLTADNCFDLLVCGGRQDESSGREPTLQELVAGTSRVWAHVASRVRAQFLSAHPRPSTIRAQRGHAVKVAVHIRRGDTVLQTHRHMGDAMLLYFNRTMSMLRTRYAQAGRAVHFIIVTDEQKSHWVYNQTSRLPLDSDEAYAHFLHPASGGFGTSFGTFSQRTAVHRLFGPQPDTTIADGATLIEDFNTMLHADVLVMSLSSLSLSAAFLRPSGSVIAPACMHTISTFVPLGSWELFDCCPRSSPGSVAPMASTGSQGRRLSRGRGRVASAPPKPPSFC